MNRWATIIRPRCGLIKPLFVQSNHEAQGERLLAGDYYSELISALTPQHSLLITSPSSSVMLCGDLFDKPTTANA